MLCIHIAIDLRCNALRGRSQMICKSTTFLAFTQKNRTFSNSVLVRFLFGCSTDAVQKVAHSFC